jgi:hypothetical protein
MTIGRVLAIVAAVVLVVPAAASASHLNMSFAVVGNGDLVAGVRVVLPVEVSCDPFAPSPFGGSFASVQINLQQKVGREITQASGFVTPVCDGTPHTYQVAITPSGGSLAFHGGRALASLSGQICTLDPVTFQQHCSTFLSSEEVRIHG